MLWLLETLCFVLTAAALALAWKYLALRREAADLLRSLHQLCRGETAPARPRLHEPTLDSSLRLALLLAAKNRQETDAKSAFADAIALGKQVADSADEERHVAEAVLELLAKHGKPEVCAAAIVVRDEEQKELRIAALRGLPKKRGENALLVHADFMLDDREHASACWGYHTPEEGSPHDFSAFGIGLSLSVGLRHQGLSCGLLWLGMKRGTPLFCPKRKQVVYALAEHAAASFSAARLSKARTEKSNRERDFLLGLSHDLRAPGNAALYAVRELLAGELGGLNLKQQECMLVLERLIAEQLSLLGDVLDYAKHQKGLLHANKTAVHLPAAVQNSIDEYRADAAKKGLAFFCDPLPETTVLVDAGHLRRMLANLLGNAVKYTEKGMIRLAACARGEHIQFTVADTGIGVREEDREYLFTEFQRGKNSRICEGVGLGLALTKLLAELNGGKAAYEPNPGGGSIFLLSLPQAVSIEKAAPAALLESVLVLEDDSFARRTIVRYLGGMAQCIIETASVSEARQVLAEQKPQLIISDYQLADGRGTELAAIAGQGVPFLLITGSAEIAAANANLAQACFQVLEKPVDRQSLRAAVEILLAQTRPDKGALAA